jgi:Protein of unknown function (DUF4058)
MAIHDWTKAPSGFFHNFHQHWAVHLCEALNAGRLPKGYYALVDRTTLGVAPDVFTLEGRTPPGPRRGRSGTIALAEAPPKTRFVSQSTEEEGYAARANRVVVRDAEDEVVAIIEIVSPGNKSSRHAIKSFVDKTIDLLGQGINLLIIDLFPPTPRDPRGMHEKIWSELTDEPFAPPSDKPLILASYVAGVPLRAFAEPVAVGDMLPDMPLFLDTANYVLAPLEDSYQVTWRACPEEFQERITGASPENSDPAEASPSDNGS